MKGDGVIGRTMGAPSHAIITSAASNHPVTRSPRHSKTFVDVDDRLDVTIRILEDSRVVTKTIEAAGDESGGQTGPERFETRQVFDAKREVLPGGVNAADHHFVAPQQAAVDGRRGNVQLGWARSTREEDQQAVVAEDLYRSESRCCIPSSLEDEVDRG